MCLVTICLRSHYLIKPKATRAPCLISLGTVSKNQKLITGVWQGTLAVPLSKWRRIFREGREGLEDKYLLSNEKGDSLECVLHEIMQQVSKASTFTASATGSSPFSTLPSPGPSRTTSTLSPPTTVKHFPVVGLGDEEVTDQHSNRDFHKVVKGIKHNTIQLVCFRGAQAPGRQLKLVATLLSG